MPKKPSQKIKVLELFAGSRSFSKVADDFGFKTYCTDIQSFKKIDQVCDIFDFNLEKCVKSFGGFPDIIWASPPVPIFLWHQLVIIGIQTIRQKQRMPNTALK